MAERGSDHVARADDPTPRPAGGAARPRAQLLRIAVSLALLGLLLLLVDLEAAWRVVASARLDLLGLMLACLVGERLFAAWRWLVLVRTVEPGVAYWPVLRITLVSNFIGTFLPGMVGTEVLRVYGLARVMADLSLALSSVLIERLCGLLSLVLLIVVGLVIAPIDLPVWIQVACGLTLLALVLAVGMLVHPWPRRLVKRTLAAPGLARLAERLVGFERRIDAYVRRPLALVLSLGLALSFQLLRIATMVIGAHALGVDVAHAIFVVIVPITFLVVQLPISLGGLGPREITYVALLGLAGVQPEASLVLALTREAMHLATTLPGALLYARGPTVARTPASS